MNKIDKAWFFTAEFFMIIGYIAIGYGLSQKNLTTIILGIINGIIWTGIRDLYIRKYNIKPFYYKYYPKAIRDEYK